nr:polygalacturonase inhibiting protein [Lilium regale]
MASTMRMGISSLLSLATLLLISNTSVVLSDRCHRTDESALLAIKASVNIRQPSWTPGTNCCNWVGVQCNNTFGRVTFVYIDPSGRSGTIPSAVGDLPFLQTFMIRHHGGLTGQIPPAIGRLTQLTWLQLDHNSLTGPIPPSVFLLPNINYLDFTHNHLTGTIPPVIPANTPLTYLYLYNNHLTGTIPDSLGRTNIKTFYLSNNNLTGPLPASFANAKFQLLDLSSNPLTGDASLLFGAKKPLTSLLLSRNRLDFDLTNIVFPEGLQNLDLSHNKIYGSIPKQIAQLNFDGPTSFNVSYNKLCGKIPTGGLMGQFDQFVYIQNKCLCGSPLPPCRA